MVPNTKESIWTIPVLRFCDGQWIGKGNLIYVQNVSFKTCLNYPGIFTFGNTLPWIPSVATHFLGAHLWPQLLSVSHGHCSGWGPALRLTQLG